MTRDDVVEGVADLADMGIRAAEWPARLGRTPAALSRALYRAGRPDLANPVESIAGRQYRSQRSDQPCPECGGPVRRTHTYCSRRCAGYATNRRLRRARERADSR